MDIATSFERLPNLVNGDAALVRRGRFVDLDFLVRIGESSFHVAVEAGRIGRVERGPLLLRPSAFVVSAEAETWRRFWQPMPAPGWHDLFALTKEGRMTIDGDLRPFMANLQYFKDVLAAPRLLAGKG